MAWRRPGAKPLSEPAMVRSPTHICVARPQWVKLGETARWLQLPSTTGTNFSLKFAPWMWSLALYIFARWFWTARETLVKQPPGPLLGESAGRNAMTLMWSIKCLNILLGASCPESGKFRECCRKLHQKIIMQRCRLLFWHHCYLFIVIWYW